LIFCSFYRIFINQQNNFFGIEITPKENNTKMFCVRELRNLFKSKSLAPEFAMLDVMQAISREKEEFCNNLLIK
jgi:hypothetical protein